MLRKGLLVLALLGACAMGCSGSSSPTSSTGFELLINTNIANASLSPTIIEASMLLDGVLAADAPFSPAQAIAPLSAQGSAGSGAHSLQVIIAQQTSSPNNYTVTAPTIQVFDANGTLLKTIQLTNQTASLVTGGGVSYSFSL